MTPHTGSMHTTAPIDTLTPRTIASVSGRIVSMQVEPRNAAPTLRVRVDDGTGRIEAVFMGRREIRGIEPGASIQLRGRVCETASVPRIFNPSFELGL